jgi:uncharacterized protein YjbI with pentapeptide repeats
LELITPNEVRRQFLSEFKQHSRKQDLNEMIKERSGTEQLSKDVIEIYRELLKCDINLRDFLYAGAADILSNINDIEEYRRVLSTTKIDLEDSREELLILLRKGNIKEFRHRRGQSSLANPNFTGVDLSQLNLAEIDLSDINLINADLSGTILSNADLSYADLSYANLSGTILSNADLSGTILTKADLSYADLSSTIIIGCKAYSDLKCTDTDFNDAIIDDSKLSDRLRVCKAKNVPSAAINIRDLRARLRQKGLNEEDVKKLVSDSSLSHH